MINILSHQENANQKDFELTLGMSKIKISKDHTKGQGCGAKGRLHHWWYKCNLVQPVWKLI